MNKHFYLHSQEGLSLQFDFYLDAAPVTSKAFAQTLPFTTTWLHAKTSGQEIWIDNAPLLDIIQENASVFTAIGEVVIGPQLPERNKIMGCMGIYYGEGKGLDAGNIFAKISDIDLNKLQSLGEAIWRNGSQVMTLSLQKHP